PSPPPRPWEPAGSVRPTLARDRARGGETAQYTGRSEGGQPTHWPDVVRANPAGPRGRPVRGGGRRRPARDPRAGRGGAPPPRGGAGGGGGGGGGPRGGGGASASRARSPPGRPG